MAVVIGLIATLNQYMDLFEGTLINKKMVGFQLPSWVMAVINHS